MHRTPWFFVKFASDGIGVHLLKWTWRAQIGNWRNGIGLGIVFHARRFSVNHLKITVIAWSIVIERLATYRLWPWEKDE